jgi:hypothetical protein
MYSGSETPESEFKLLSLPTPMDCKNPAPELFDVEPDAAPVEAPVSEPSTTAVPVNDFA